MKGDLHIKAQVKNGHTILGSVYNTPPFKLADITADRTMSKLKLMIMSASPGVLDGDLLRIRIELAEGADVVLSTQSYQRLFQMKNGAVQAMDVYLDDHASFCYLPHPVVPHKASSFTAHNRVFLSGQCSLIWGEVLTCGRQLNGETFSFARYHSKTEIFLNKRLVVKENLFLQPSAMDITSMGQMEGYTHQASFIYMDEKASVQELYTQVSEFLTNEQDIDFGVSVLPVNGLAIRLLGYKAEQLYNCLQQIKELIQSRSCTIHKHAIHH